VPETLRSFPQGISLALSIRELIRQGYLFAALVLVRPLIERAVRISSRGFCSS
jgi:hypothetical protein